jgi:hypothetical protein
MHFQTDDGFVLGRDGIVDGSAGGHEFIVVRRLRFGKRDALCRTE